MIITVSNGIKRTLIGINESKIKTIYNPFPIKEIKDKSQYPIEKFLDDFIVNVGRLTKAKGQWYLLRIFREVKKQFPNLKLVILGEGELKESTIKNPN